MKLSYSQLSTYARCPKQYEYASVKKISRPLSAGESFGSSIHNTLRKFGLLEMEHARPESLKQLKLFTEDHAHHKKADLSEQTLLMFWRESFIADGYEGREDMDAAFTRGERCLRHFHTWWKTKQRTLIGVEYGFRYLVPDTEEAVLSGRFDRVEKESDGLVIIDFKSSAPRSADALEEDLQLSVYALAAEREWGMPVQSLMLLCLGENGIVEQRTTRSEKALKEALEEIRSLSQGMKKANYSPTPSLSVCRSCPYREICPSRA